MNKKFSPDEVFKLKKQKIPGWLSRYLPQTTTSPSLEADKQARGDGSQLSVTPDVPVKLGHAKHSGIEPPDKDGPSVTQNGPSRLEHAKRSDAEPSGGIEGPNVTQNGTRTLEHAKYSGSEPPDNAERLDVTPARLEQGGLPSTETPGINKQNGVVQQNTLHTARGQKKISRRKERRKLGQEARGDNKSTPLEWRKKKAKMKEAEDYFNSIMGPRRLFY